MAFRRLTRKQIKAYTSAVQAGRKACSDLQLAYRAPVLHGSPLDPFPKWPEELRSKTLSDPPN